MTRDRRTEEPAQARLTIETKDAIPEELRAYAHEKLLAAMSRADRPVLSAAVHLSTTTASRGAPAATAKATLDVNGQTIHVHATEPTLREAVDALDARLRRRLTDTKLRRALRRHPRGRFRLATRGR